MISLEAPAKLTLTLRVTGVREDGYHLIDAEMVALALTDIVRIEDSPTTQLTVTGPFATGVPTDESNLVHKALARSNRTAKVRIEKNIPHGGGLGGGSTDAAAVLRWAEHTDPIHAAALGADVPFSLVGGRAHVAGIGEKVTPLPYECQRRWCMQPGMPWADPREPTGTILSLPHFTPYPNYSHGGNELPLPLAFSHIWQGPEPRGLPTATSLPQAKRPMD